MSVATQLVLRSFSEGGRVTTENAPFADRNKNFLPFLKTFEIASSVQTSENEKKNGAVAKPVCRKHILMVFFVRSERRLQRLRKGFCIKKQPLPKRFFFISFEKSSGNNRKCLRTLGKLRSLCTKMLFQNFQVMQ